MASIYIYSPAGAVRDKAGFKRGVARLKALGHSVEIDPSALASVQRFAGSDEERVAAIARAAASGADVALITRGGYGLTRILPELPYKAMAKSIERKAQPMLWLGYSDFTALQAALFAKTGAVTWAGPALCEDFGRSPDSDGHGAASAEPVPDEIMEACFGDLLEGVCEGAGWQMPKSSATHLIANYAVNSAANGQKGLKNQETSDNELVVTGQLWGGNLAMLSVLLGTPYLPAINKGILWFEDVGEQPYKVERMLSQWLHAGILQKQKAIVFGQFSSYKLTPHDKGFKLQSVIDRLSAQLKVPVLQGLPFGHVATKVCLPFGAKTRLMVQGRDALLYWG